MSLKLTLSEVWLSYFTPKLISFVYSAVAPLFRLNCRIPHNLLASFFIPCWISFEGYSTVAPILRICVDSTVSYYLSIRFNWKLQWKWSYKHNRHWGLLPLLAVKSFNPKRCLFAAKMYYPEHRNTLISWYLSHLCQTWDFNLHGGNEIKWTFVLSTSLKKVALLQLGECPTNSSIQIRPSVTHVTLQWKTFCFLQYIKLSSMHVMQKKETSEQFQSTCIENHSRVPGSAVTTRENN